MRAILLSGLWPTPDFNGLSELADRIRELGHTVDLFHYDDRSLKTLSHDYQIYIGHSLGAEKALELIQQSGRGAKYFGAIDFVTHAWFPFFFWNAGKFIDVPFWIQRCDAFQRSWPLIPPSSKILNPGGYYRNYTGINFGHADMPRNSVVTSTILQSIRSLS